MLLNFAQGFIPDFLIIPLFLIVGIAGLYFGAEMLVKGSADLALHFNVRPIVVGLTVVAFGTSAPELVVSLMAALSNEADMSVGNIVGSNIANIGLIIGLTATIVPIARETKPALFEYVFLVGASLLLIVLSIGGMLGRPDGLLLFSLLAIFLYFCFRTGRDMGKEVPAEAEKTMSLSIAMVAIALVILPVAAHFMVEGATSLALKLGVSKLVIGATVVAFGTSLPELATSMIAVARGQYDIGVGNIIGSNIFNICCVLGLAPMLHPLEITPSIMPFHYPAMMFFTILFVLFTVRAEVINRKMGAVLLGAFIVYVTLSYTLD